MVQSGHPLLAAPPPPALAGDVPPPPPGELVPHEGYIVFSSPLHRAAVADYIRAVHLPGWSRIEVRWPFSVRIHRRCAWCKATFPCAAVRWALDVDSEGPAAPATPAPPHQHQPLWDGPTLIHTQVVTPAQQARGNGGRR
ncbi:hypothetical protein [Micromonospora cathayae]|uniref:Uncharacterized protein n=1 Tax=Micromonospora cathayae TaxID=3028804 RepID=A0ABY7ZPX3_9ACTN|nr:hypothetical protein [Micromonospora sp. HUAS 3]WDZ83999.1 hypothetical protein PVK37_26585 [Micromonospora sp. HUAS 3]